jgi:hypothetical protein
MRQGRIPHQETIKRLLAVRETCSSWAQVTARLGYLPRMAATLQKVLTGAPGAISARAERDLRVRLGLPAICDERRTIKISRELYDMMNAERKARGMTWERVLKVKFGGLT